MIEDWFNTSLWSIRTVWTTDLNIRLLFRQFPASDEHNAEGYVKFEGFYYALLLFGTFSFLDNSI